MFQKGTAIATVPLGNAHIENWGESGMADNSQQSDDASTDIDTDDKTQVGLCFSKLPSFAHKLVNPKHNQSSFY